MGISTQVVVGVNVGDTKHSVQCPDLNKCSINLLTELQGADSEQ